MLCAFKLLGASVGEGVVAPAESPFPEPAEEPDPDPVEGGPVGAPEPVAGASVDGPSAEPVLPPPDVSAGGCDGVVDPPVSPELAGDCDGVGWLWADWSCDPVLEGSALDSDVADFVLSVPPVVAVVDDVDALSVAAFAGSAKPVMAMPTIVTGATMAATHTWIREK